MRFAQRFVFLAGFGIERSFLLCIEQRIDHADGAGRVQDVDCAFVIMRRDLYGRVRPTRRSSANQ